MNYVVDIFCPIFESASENILKCDPYQLSIRYVKLRPLQVGNFVTTRYKSNLWKKIKNKKTDAKISFLMVGPADESWLKSYLLFVHVRQNPFFLSSHEKARFAQGKRFYARAFEKSFQ